MIKFIWNMFVYCFVSVSLQEILMSSENLPKISWEHNAKDDAFPLVFDGIPYVWLGRRQYQCHQGKDKAVKQKANYKQSIRSKLISDHCSSVKTRKLTQPTKKLNCPVTFHAKKIFKFPEHRISKDTKWNRTMASKEIKTKLESFKKDVNTSQSFGCLEYLTHFPHKGNLFFFYQDLKGEIYLI